MVWEGAEVCCCFSYNFAEILGGKCFELGIFKVWQVVLEFLLGNWL